MTPDEIEHTRELDRARQARRRERSNAGSTLIVLPPEIADELGDDDDGVSLRVIEILRRHLARVRDIA
jgi:hypothetical protein